MICTVKRLSVFCFFVFCFFTFEKFRYKILSIYNTRDNSCNVFTHSLLVCTLMWQNTIWKHFLSQLVLTFSGLEWYGESLATVLVVLTYVTEGHHCHHLINRDNSEIQLKHYLPTLKDWCAIRRPQGAVSWSAFFFWPWGRLSRSFMIIL